MPSIPLIAFSSILLACVIAQVIDSNYRSSILSNKSRLTRSLLETLTKNEQQLAKTEQKRKRVNDLIKKTKHDWWKGKQFL